MSNADTSPSVRTSMKINDSERPISNHSIDLNISISHVSKEKKFDEPRYRNEPDLLISDSNINQSHSNLE